MVQALMEILCHQVLPLFYGFLSRPFQGFEFLFNSWLHNCNSLDLLHHQLIWFICSVNLIYNLLNQRLRLDELTLLLEHCQFLDTSPKGNYSVVQLVFLILIFKKLIFVTVFAHNTKTHMLTAEWNRHPFPIQHALEVL